MVHKSLLQYNITGESPLWQQIAFAVVLSALLIIYNLPGLHFIILLLNYAKY